MAFSQVSVDESLRVKKKLYMNEMDEYSGSSQPLNSIVLSTVLNVMPQRHSNKRLKPGYVADLTREGGISPCSMMLGLLYIKRLSQLNPAFLNTVSSRELFLISMMVASKYLNDEGEMEALTNSDFAIIGYTPKSRLDQLEMNFLQAMDWKLFVSLEEYYGFVTSVEGRVALNQASQRGWFTYTDICAIWEATDIQNNMLTASKQTAKVACGGALLYLMCVATLFASAPTLHSSNDTSSLTISSSRLTNQNETSSLLPLSDLSLNQSTFDPSQFEDQPDRLLNGGVNRDFLRLKPLQNYSLEIGIDTLTSSLSATCNSLQKPTECVSRNTCNSVFSVRADRHDRRINCTSDYQTKPPPIDTSGYIGTKERKKDDSLLMSKNAERPHSSESHTTGGLCLESSVFLLLNLTAALTSPDLLSDSPQVIKASSPLNPLTTALLCPGTPTRIEWVNGVGMSVLNSPVCSLRNDVTFELMETNEEDTTAKNRSVPSYQELPVNPLLPPSPCLSCISNPNKPSTTPKPSTPCVISTPPSQDHSDSSFGIGYEDAREDECDRDTEMDYCTSDTSTVTCLGNYRDQLSSDDHLYKHSSVISPSTASEFRSPLFAVDAIPTVMESRTISVVMISPFLTPGREKNNFTLIEAFNFFARSVLAF